MQKTATYRAIHERRGCPSVGVKFRLKESTVAVAKAVNILSADQWAVGGQP